MAGNLTGSLGGSGNYWMAAANMAIAYGSYKTSKARANQMFKIGELNSELNEFDAVQSLIASKERERLRNDDIIIELSTQRAQVGSSGVSLSSGSPLMVFADTLEKGEKDVQAIREQGKTDAWRIRMSGRQQATDTQIRATSMKTAAKGRLLSQAMQSGGAAYKQYDTGNQ